MKELLPILLQIANTNPGGVGFLKPAFYEIKNTILRRSGKIIGYDLQEIEGKKCWSCDNGWFTHWSGHQEPCYKCYGKGWYKVPTWVILAKVKYGDYTFHQPLKRFYYRPPSLIEIGELVGSSFTLPGKIDGYIEHQNRKGSYIANMILFYLFGAYDVAYRLLSYHPWESVDDKILQMEHEILQVQTIYRKKLDYDFETLLHYEFPERMKEAERRAIDKIEMRHLRRYYPLTLCVHSPFSNSITIKDLLRLTTDPVEVNKSIFIMETGKLYSLPIEVAKR